MDKENLLNRATRRLGNKISSGLGDYLAKPLFSKDPNGTVEGIRQELRVKSWVLGAGYRVALGTSMALGFAGLLGGIVSSYDFDLTATRGSYKEQMKRIEQQESSLRNRLKQIPHIEESVEDNETLAQYRQERQDVTKVLNELGAKRHISEGKLRGTRVDWLGDKIEGGAITLCGLIITSLGIAGAETLKDRRDRYNRIFPRYKNGLRFKEGSVEDKYFQRINEAKARERNE